MSGFDRSAVYYSDAFPAADENNSCESGRNFAIEALKKFILQFQDSRMAYSYRDQLKHNYNMGNYLLHVDLKDLANFKEELSDRVVDRPAEYIPLFETAAKQAADEVTYPRPQGDEVVRDVQVNLTWRTDACPVREIRSDRVSKLVKTSGVVVSVSSVKMKAVNVTLMCRVCRTTIPNIKLKSGIDGYALPRKCPSSNPGANPGGMKPTCPLDPFFVIPDKCVCVDSQVIKLQEAPNVTPTGEMPRHLHLYCDRGLVDKVSPGNKISVIGIYSIKRVQAKAKDAASGGIGVRKPYLRLVGISTEVDSLSSRHTLGLLDQRVPSCTSQEEDEKEFRKFASRPDVYSLITRSIAPSIYGNVDVKMALACMLFGGSSIALPDGLILRGDINVLLLGDPGTAKSQLLKFVEKAAPIGLYTSGKGSSAAGLTASVNRDPSTGAFVIEGGAMVLGDGGCVCIDEFDKMREDDRVAIHEAMEQQTISISKAGITTTLNSRCAVLAAANSVFGRWDDLKGGENINFMPTILSRFDMIFIMKDDHSEEKDIRVATHVLNVHMLDRAVGDDESNELSISFLRKYIDYARKTCGPRLSDKAAEKLRQYYISLRNGAKENENTVGKRSPIIMTVRQLEAISRIGEALAKMRLQPYVSQDDVEEAIRLFRVSTWDAANRGSFAGAEGFTSLGDVEEIRRIERQIKQRFAVGAQVAQQRVIEDLLRQKFASHAVYRVLNTMMMRGELEQRLQGKVLFRVR